ncbi:DUF4199 domain-containing protein [soil metagenome]
MRKVVLTYSLIGGFIMICFVFLIMTLCDRDMLSIDRAQYVGYASMVIALSMIFFGIKSYRDNYSNGVIRFWKGVQVGRRITAIASVLYFVGGELYSVVNPNFSAKVMKKYADHEEKKLADRGASAEEMENVRTETENIQKMIKNPAIRFGLALFEILPVGVVITLVSAGLLRKRELFPASDDN